MTGNTDRMLAADLAYERVNRRLAELEALVSRLERDGINSSVFNWQIEALQLELRRRDAERRAARGGKDGPSKSAHK